MGISDVSIALRITIGMAVAMSLALGIGPSAATGDEDAKQARVVVTARAVTCDSLVDQVRRLGVRFLIALAIRRCRNAWWASI